jgi:hypothetical protein
LKLALIGTEDQGNTLVVAQEETLVFFKYLSLGEGISAG